MTTVYIPVEAEKELPTRTTTHFTAWEDEGRMIILGANMFMPDANKFDTDDGAQPTHWFKRIELDLSEESIEKMAEERFPSFLKDYDFGGAFDKREGYITAMLEIRQLLNMSK